MPYLAIFSVLTTIFMLPYSSFAAERGVEFGPASSPDEIQLRQRLLPDDDIWWTVTGEQMAWMHKNVHQLFPTVNVYRAGPVSILNVEPNSKIENFEISTTNGSIGFSNFLESEHSTAMGMVILHQGKIVYEHYPRMQHYEKPIYWSVTKVMPATLIRIYEEQGKIDVEKAIQFYLPELTN